MKVVGNKNGKKVVLLNPAEKKAKYKRELKEGIKRTNSDKYKTDKNGKMIRLTDSDRAWRAGYISSSIDGSKAHFANKKKRKAKNY